MRLSGIGKIFIRRVKSEQKLHSALGSAWEVRKGFADLFWQPLGTREVILTAQ